MGQNLDSMKPQRTKAELLYDIVVTTGNVVAIKALFREGAGLEWTDSEGKNSLMVACTNHKLIDAAKTLIQLGANVNSYRPGHHAGTPLHHAAKAGLVQTVKLLLSSGANALVRNDDTQTPLDVARQNNHTDAVRAIEKHICHFSGWVRQFYGPGFLEALTSNLFSRKIWAVVIPYGPDDPTMPRKLQLALYYTLQDAQPFTVVSLWRAQIEEPNLSQLDPKLAVFDNATKYRHRLASDIPGDKQQLQSFYNACRGISQVVPSQISRNTQSSEEGANLATTSPSDSIQSASAEISPAPDSHLTPEASNTNGWGTSANDDSCNGQGLSVGTANSEPDSTGCVDKQVKEDYNGWSTQDHEPTSRGRHAGTPLHHAAKEGRLLEIMELILSNRANALVRNDDGETPLDVARQNRHTNVVREIEHQICYFYGWVRQIYGPGSLEALSSYLFSRKIWVVVIPHGPNEPTEPLKLELALYYTSKDAQPFTVIPLWRARIEEPNLSQSDPKLIVFDDSTKYRHRLESAIQGDKQQLQSLFNACQGICQVLRFPFSHSIQSSLEGAELAPASSDSIQSDSMEISPAPDSHPIPEASNTNGWRTSAQDDSYNGWGLGVGTSHSDPNSTGWMDEQVKEDYNGWSTHDHEPSPHGNQTKQSQTSDESTPSVSENNVSVSLTPAPSAPLLPEEILLEEPTHYPTIDLGSDTFPQPTDNEASASSCVICWEAAIEGACIPCGHLAGCMSCLTEIKSKKSVCPVCRSKIIEVVRIYAV